MYASKHECTILPLSSPELCLQQSKMSQHKNELVLANPSILKLPIRHTYT